MGFQIVTGVWWTLENSGRPAKVIRKISSIIVVTAIMIIVENREVMKKDVLGGITVVRRVADSDATAVKMKKIVIKATVVQVAAVVQEAAVVPVEAVVP